MPSKMYPTALGTVHKPKYEKDAKGRALLDKVNWNHITKNNAKISR